MKNLTIYSCILGLICSGCNLDRTPFSHIAEDDLTAIEGSLASLTVGNYSQLKGWVENWHRITEYPGTNVSLSGTTSDHLYPSYNLQRLVNSIRVNNFWEMSYRNIVGCNLIIERIAEGESDEHDQLLAENLYLRGMLYFYLTNVFGRPYNQGPDNLSVPIKLSTNIQENPIRSTVEEVYLQIEQDLLRAEQLFTSKKKNIYASKEVAQALLARMYLYQGKNDKALEYADKVIQSGRYSLLPTSEFPNYSIKIPEDNSETIFAIRHVKDVDYASNGWFTIGSLYAHYLGSGWGEMYASRTYLELIRKYPTDVRYTFIEAVPTNNPTQFDETWALYVNDDYRYAYKVVSAHGDDYTYLENGVIKRLIKQPNNVDGYDYFVEDGNRLKTVLIEEAMDMRNGYPKYYISKASGQEGQAHLLSPVISRLAEIYLIRAEANAKLGNYSAALNDVNTLRTRAGIPDVGLYTLSNLGKKSVMDVIMEERQLELAWEGHSKFDHIRNGITIDRRYPGTHLSGATPLFVIPASSPSIIEYIPERQIVLSGGVLTQNP
ncbi:RagB/SusD family nutrient uptake outer membrane protein [Sphingobacterium corticis]|uniref:RagB/SusD family nutrient uptake outer membrane protein n=1 Tax=Sphingobacterium corticis TaxID=1812823 RepID=A0ABW5NFU4_9SPHI